MFIKAIEISGYRPFQHGRIQTLSATFPSVLTLIIADNGSGKSSLLREMTPYPAVSTDYLPDGRRCLTIVHNNSEYILISDFSNKKHTHSFLRDNEELNISGTSNVQQELAKSEFGYTQTIDGIVSYKFGITGLKKAQRKDLFFETYPGDISFILDEHKSVCSMIRKNRNNLSMLDDMKSEIQSQMLKPDEIEKMKQQKEALDGRNSSLDRSVYMVEQEQKSIRSDSDYICNDKLNTDRLDVEKIKYKAQSILAEASETRLFAPDIFGEQSPDTVKEIKKAFIDSSGNKLTNLLESADSLREQIAEYEALEHTTVEDEIKSEQKKLNTYHKLLQQLRCSDDIPVLEGESLKQFQDHLLKRILDMLESLDKISPGIKSEQEINNLHNEQQNRKERISRMEGELQDKQTARKKLEQDLEKRKELSPPGSCAIPSCKLRRDFDRWSQEINNTIKTLEKESEEMYESAKQEKKEYERLNEKLSGPCSVRETVSELTSLLEWVEWRNWLLDGKDPITAFNEDLNGIRSRLKKLENNSVSAANIKEYTKKTEEAENRIEFLNNIDRPGKDLVQKTMLEKSYILDKTLEEITSIRRDISTSHEMIRKTERIQNLYGTLTDLKERFDKYGRHIVLTEMEKYNDKLLKHLNEEKRECSERLREIENTLEKQRDLQSRMNESVDPRYKSVSNRLRKLAMMEPVLSPAGGIPSQHIARFINNIIVTANSIMHAVWGYGLEMQCLDENTALDFSLPVAINEGSILQDCSMCSQGEQEILNLSFMLAMCRVLHLSDNYPLRLDEPDSAMSHGNRNRLATLLSDMLSQEDVRQLFIINHFHALFTAFKDTDIICLNPANIVLPEEYNNNIKVN